MTGSQGQFDEQRLNREYQQQMEAWRRAAGIKHWRDILRATRYFFADQRNQEELRSDTISKTLKTRPTRVDGIYNLLTLLGVLYVLGGVKSKAEVQTFLVKFLID